MKKFKVGGMLTLLALTAVVGLSACSTNPETGSSNGAKTENVATSTKYVNKDGSILLGKHGAIKQGTDTSKTPILDVYFDPMCPGCGDFEREAGSYIKEQVKKGDIIVRYHPLMFLDNMSDDYYSSRASAYLTGVAAHAPKLVSPFIEKLMSREFQPIEGNYVKKANTEFDKILKAVGGNDSQVKAINSDMESNMNFVYENTLDVMKDNDLTAKSPTGQLFTPFIVPNKAGEEGKHARPMQDSMLNEAKAAIEAMK